MNLKIVNNIKKKEYKKLEELQFLDQLWFTINPSMNEYINIKFFYEFLKLMLSSEKKFLNGDIIKDLSLSIESLLNQNYCNNDSIKSYNTELFISPLSNKKYEQTDLWSVPKLVKIFFKLKSHKNNEDRKDKILYSKEDEEKELTFKPNLEESNTFFQKYSKFNYYNYHQNDKNADTKCKNNKNDFDKLYERWMNEQKMRDKAIEIMREKKIMKEMRRCTDKPKINKYYPRSQEKVVGAFDKEKKLPIYERLYNLRQSNNENDSSRRCKTSDFRPANISSREEMNKAQFNYNKKKNPKENNDILKNQNKIIGDKIYEKNYDKIQNMKKPINSTYLNNSNKINKKMNENSEQDDNDIIDNIYITIEIKINNGQLKPLKIYKNQNDTNEMMNNFFEMYNISEEDKKVIFNKVKYYQKVFFKGE